MSAEVKKEKAILRREIMTQQRELEPAYLRRSDERIFNRLRTLPEYQAASRVFIFVGAGAEPDTRGLISDMLAGGRLVAVPLCLSAGEMTACEIRSTDDLKPGHFGIYEPGEDLPRMGPNEFDLVIVPAVCYDRKGFRLGRGGGYYDRYLSSCGAFSVGLCRGCFLQEALPREEHDRRVDAIITETETIRPVD